MAKNPNPDRNKDYMREMWGTNKLITDYSSLESPPFTTQGDHFSHGISPSKSRMLREIENDDLTPKKHDFHTQNEIHEKIRNDDDYDDWEYGTEPLYG